MRGRSYRRPSRLERLEAFAAQPPSPAEGEMARAAAERLRAKLANSPQVSAAPVPLPNHLARWQGLLRTVAEARAKDRAALLWWAASRARDARKAGSISYVDLTLLVEALRRTALAAGMGGWECERALSRSMKCQPLPRDRR